MPKDTSIENTTYHYYQLRYDSHQLNILTESLEFLKLTPYYYVAGKEYKTDSTPHRQCIIALENELDQNQKVKLRTKLKRMLKTLDITHKNAVAVATAKSPWDLLNYCRKEGQFDNTFNASVCQHIASLPRKETDKQFKDKRQDMIKQSLYKFEIEPIQTFYHAVIKFHLKHNKVPPSRNYLRFLALQYKLLNIEHYIQIIGLNND